MPRLGGGTFHLTKRPATQAVRRSVAGGFARGSDATHDQLTITNGLTYAATATGSKPAYWFPHITLGATQAIVSSGAGNWGPYFGCTIDNAGYLLTISNNNAICVGFWDEAFGDVFGKITGAGGLTQRGGGQYHSWAGTVTSDYTGPTLILSGDLRLNDPDMFGTTAAGTVLVGGRAYINSGPFTIGEGFTISNACEWRYYDNNGGFTHTGPITLAGGAWLQMRHRGDKFPIVFAGAIDDRDGPGVVDNYYWQSDTANDTQWLTKFNGNNTYSGPTTNYQGTLLINGTTSGQGDYVMRKITGTVWGGANLGGTGTVGLASGKTIILSSVTNAGGTAGANDRLIVTGGHVDLTSDGTQRLTITNSAGSTLSGAYVLATFDAASGYGRFDTVTYNGGPLPPGYMVHYEPTQIEFGPPHMPGVLMMVR